MGAEIKIYNPDGIAKPLGKYSHCARVKGGETLYIAGQVGVDTDGKLAEGLEAQVRQTFANLQAALGSAGAEFANVVKFTTYLVDAADIPGYMSAREAVFPEIFPAGVYPPNTLVVCAGLVKPEILIEIEAVAAI
ncbi:MAG: RidA family protein [Gammaproteobacteria bacterium]|nr:RidA family protein [Gammaproteobacteria bacterium]